MVGTLTKLQLSSLAALGSAGLLAGAFIFQFFDYAPCKMCIWQRYPHVIAVIIGVLALKFRASLVMLAGAAAAFTTAAIGLFHAGVEQGFWEGPSTCSSGAIDNLSADDLMEQIMSAPLVRCDEIPWELFGISMAGWNGILSLGLAMIWLLAARRA